ncbi:MAG: EF-Tu/IF-2/RF-3 family GTPase [Candidatus Micrarchaeaceae archaeon]
MANVVVAVPLDKKLAEFIGKKGTENSITFYNRRTENGTIVALAPTSIDEKFYAAAESILIAGGIVLSTENVNAAFGEMLVAAALSGKPVIFVGDNRINGFAKNAKIEKFTYVGLEGLIGEIERLGIPEGGGKRVDIDKAFKVTGIGTVVLGIVTSGKIAVHDELYHTSGKKVTVKSIQIQDEDKSEAGAGSRVGLALKNIEPDEIEKGDLLTDKIVERRDMLNVELKKSEFGNESIEEGKTFMFASNFSYASVSVKEASGNGAKLQLDKPLPLVPGDNFFLIRGKVPRIFAFGKIV